MSERTDDLLTEVSELCEKIIDTHSGSAENGIASTGRALIDELAHAGLLDPELMDDGSSSRADSTSDTDNVSAATAIIGAVAANAPNVPVVEHLWTASHLLRTAELTPPSGLMTAAVTEALTIDHLGEGLLLTGTASNVAHVEEADVLVILAGEGTLAHVPRSVIAVSDTRTLGGMSWSTVKLAEVRVPADAHAQTSLTVSDFRERNAVGRLLQIRSAADRATELTVSHLSSRVQFGRPLRKFQAAQNRLSACIGETILLGIGADLALAGRPEDLALARVDARRSVTIIRDNTHQLHGAMGITAEYPLGQLNATMLAWLADTGPDHRWLGEAKTDIDEHGVWAAITGEEDEP